MRVAIYLRVSTKDLKPTDKRFTDNEKRRQDTDNQAVALRQFAAASGWTVAVEYTERMSGKRSDRPELVALLDAASRREFDAVLVWALDRLTREGVVETFGYIKRMRGYGVEFISYTEPHFRTMGPAGDLILAVAAWIAEQEARRISERTIAGLERARREGKLLGRPRLVVDRLKLRERRAEGASLRTCAAEFGISLTACARFLRGDVDHAGV